MYLYHVPLQLTLPLVPSTPLTWASLPFMSSSFLFHNPVSSICATNLHMDNRQVATSQREISSHLSVAINCQ